MAKITEKSVRYFQQLRNRQNDLYRKNTAAIVDVSRKKPLDRALLDRLRRERAELAINDRKIDEAEMKFQASNLSQSDAEKRLIAQARRANALVRGVRTVTHILESAAQMASILARLINLL